MTRGSGSGRSAVQAGLPPEPGAYVLILQARGRARAAIGRLGTLRLEPGYYAYVGSALGPGGLRARLGRHLAPVRRRHWHIDHLRAHCPVAELWLTISPERLEDRWAGHLAGLPGAREAMPGFGASDRPGASHLIHFPDRPPFAAFSSALERAGLTPPGRVSASQLPGGVRAMHPG